MSCRYCNFFFYCPYRTWTLDDLCVKSSLVLDDSDLDAVSYNKPNAFGKGDN